MKILIMGLPGSGKTTLAKALMPKLQAVHWNADDVRANFSTDLKFTEADRIEQARRMGWLCDRVVDAGYTAIADFVCPTPDTRQAFNPTFTVWMDTISAGRFEDTNKIFVPPNKYDIKINTMDAESWSDFIVDKLGKTPNVG